MLYSWEHHTLTPLGLTLERRTSSTWASRGLSLRRRSSTLRCGGDRRVIVLPLTVIGLVVSSCKPFDMVASRTSGRSSIPVFMM